MYVLTVHVHMNEYQNEMWVCMYVCMYVLIWGGYIVLYCIVQYVC